MLHATSVPELFCQNTRNIDRMWWWTDLGGGDAASMWGPGGVRGGVLQTSTAKLDLKEPYYRMSQSPAYAWTQQDQASQYREETIAQQQVSSLIQLFRSWSFCFSHCPSWSCWFIQFSWSHGIQDLESWVVISYALLWWQGNHQKSRVWWWLFQVGIASSQDVLNGMTEAI